MIYKVVRVFGSSLCVIKVIISYLSAVYIYVYLCTMYEYIYCAKSPEQTN